MITLKQCPFCGGDAKLTHIGNEYTKKRATHISCSAFGCTVQVRVAAIVHDFNFCDEKAIKKWNTRTPTEELQAQLAELNYRYECLKSMYSDEMNYLDPAKSVDDAIDTFIQEMESHS